jgi:hypothetical protein
MTRWEYRYIALYRGAGRVTTTTMMGEGFSDFSAEVAQAGNEGWEAVGAVSLGFPGGNYTSWLMLKRPRS